MLVDGKAIQQDIKEELKRVLTTRDSIPRLAVFYVGEDNVIERFIGVKKRFGNDIGAVVDVFSYDDVQAEKLCADIQKQAEIYDGIIVQLPLPATFDTSAVLNCIPLDTDVDLLSDAAFSRFKKGEGEMVPPVAGAIAEICDRYDIGLGDAQVVVIGRGRLVGEPVIAWMKNNGIDSVVCEEGDDLASATGTADIIISGAGDPGIVTPEMIRDGSVLIDAGTSESGGKLVGDIDRACEKKASVFATVPGGVGPITIAKLFENLVACM